MGHRDHQGDVAQYKARAHTHPAGIRHEAIKQSIDSLASDPSYLLKTP